MHFTDTPEATSGVCAHRPFTLIYPRRTGSRCLRAAGPVLAIVFFYELWARRRRRGASAGPSVQRSLSALVPRRGLTFWGAAGIPFCGLCAWACGPQESWHNASAGLTVADRPMQWSQARRQACGPRDFGAAVTPPASPSLTGRCCVWVDRLTEGLSVTSESGSHALHALNVLVRLAPTLIAL